MNRGFIESVTGETKREAGLVLKRPLTQNDVRLMPYIDYCCKNMCFYPERINSEERKILSGYKKSGLLTYSSAPGHSRIEVSLPFYWLMCRVLLEIYVETLAAPVDCEKDEA
jgi:hypothetical protein